MHELNEEMTDLADAIVFGGARSPMIVDRYPQYSFDVAIGIYRNNYRGNLHDALTCAYPVIAQIVGEDFFRYMAGKFIGQHRSHSGNLHHYGAELASFLASFEPVRNLPYLADVAALEWACHLAYFAENAANLDLVNLSRIPADRYPDLILQLHPACHLVCSAFPIARIWHAHQPGADENFQIDLDDETGNALVSRLNGVVLVSELTKAEIMWLKFMKDKSRLEDATVATIEKFPDFDLHTTLLRIVANNAITNFELGETV